MGVCHRSDKAVALCGRTSMGVYVHVIEGSEE